MTPAEACRYMADPASWNGDPLSQEATLYGHFTPFEFVTMALSDTAEIIPTAPASTRPESRPCVECHGPIIPGEAYAPGPIHARHPPRR